jgi:hypothetical protein
MNIHPDSNENSNADDSADFDKDKVGAESEELGDEDEDAEQEDEDQDTDEDDEEEESESIYDDPDYLVVGSDEELCGNLPDWVESIISDRKSLAQDLEKLDLDPSDYISVPDTDDNGELKDFLDELGFSIDTEFIDRGPGSSHDSVVYIKESDIPAVIARETKTFNDAKRYAIRAAKSRLRKSLSGPRIKNADLQAELDRLIAVSRANDDDWREKAQKIDEFDETIKELNEHLEDKTKNVVLLRQSISRVKKKLSGEEYRTKKWIRKSLELSGFYAAWVAGVEAEFGIVIKGPLLKLPNGKAFAVESIYGKELKDQPNGLEWYEAIQRAEPEVEWLQLSFTSPVLYGGLRRLKWEDEQERFDGRLAWSQIWWVALSYSARGAGVIAPMKQLPAEFLKELKAKKYPAPDDIGVPPDREARWKELFLKYWGTGINWSKDQGNDEEE